MKRSVILLSILVAMSGIGRAQHVTISGTALPGNKTVVLEHLNPITLAYDALDGKKLKKNRSFRFETPFVGANAYRLVFDDREVLSLSVTDTSNIVVTRKPDDTEVIGSPSTLQYRAFRKEFETLQEQYFGKLKQDIDEAMAAGDDDRVEELNAQTGPLLEKFLVEFREMITELGTTPAVYFALGYSDFNKELSFIETRLVAFEKEIPDAPITKALATRVSKARVTAIGNKPPAIEANDMDGKTISPDDYAGKLLLVDFWAGWCRACRIENPKFVKLYNEYHKSGFDILSISQDENEEAWKKAIEKDGVGMWRHVLDSDKSISDKYSVSSLPQNIVLDQKGIIIAKNVTTEDLKVLLAELLD